jgi:hypothetical protein
MRGVTAKYAPARSFVLFKKKKAMLLSSIGSSWLAGSQQGYLQWFFRWALAATASRIPSSRVGRSFRS